jgi:cytochrome c oxidase subunit 2
MSAAGVFQSVVSPSGVQASVIHRLWLLMFWISTAVFLIVLAFAVVALVRGLSRSRDARPQTPERSLVRCVGAAVAITVAILLGLLVASVQTGRAVASLHASSAVTIAVTGHQWWWELEYEDAVPSRRAITANELHIPINRPIALKVRSRDVIHSFWVPNLQGKRDLIPGYETAIWLQADQPGRYRGQCAEFCGLQHAHMAFDVVAEPEADFDRWLDHLRQSAPEPQTDAERRGRELFMTGRCSTCHTIQGTPAQGQVAPDLTHVASRRAIGAGTLPNTPDHLAAWIANPQASKPGNQMPRHPLPPEDLQALTAYLQALR